MRVVPIERSSTILQLNPNVFNQEDTHQQKIQSETDKLQGQQQQQQPHPQPLLPRTSSFSGSSNTTTLQTCWLCTEKETPDDLFMSVCKCTGSNLIHGQCLLRITLEQLKTKKQLPQPSLFASTRTHTCSICKASYTSKHITCAYLDMQCNFKDACLLSLSIVSLLVAIGMTLVTYFVVTDGDNDNNGSSSGSSGKGGSQNSNGSTIYSGFLVFIGILTGGIALFFFLAAIFIFWKGFVKFRVAKICLEDITKHKEIMFKFNIQRKEFILYKPGQHESKKQNKTTETTKQHVDSSGSQIFLHGPTSGVRRSGSRQINRNNSTNQVQININQRGNRNNMQIPQNLGQQQSQLQQIQVIQRNSNTNVNVNSPMNNQNFGYSDNLQNST